MCGIHLIVEKQHSQNKSLESRLQYMLKLGQHRGPDAEGMFVDTFGNYAIGMAANRLHITGKEVGANQPLISSNKRYVLIFNGEIYNHYDLKNTLVGLGYQFTSSSDSETLFFALQHFGESIISQLNGIFAFVFADFQAGKMIIGRDSMGVKPLWKYETDENLVMSSETKPICEVLENSPNVSHEAIKSLLHFGYIKDGKSMYEQIVAFPKKNVLILSFSEDHIEQRYVDLEINTEITKTEGKASELRDILSETLYRQTIADHPVGLMLSGGVDSTLLLALIQKEGLHPIPSFSICYDKKDHKYTTSDQAYAAKAAEAYGSIHYEIPVSSSDLTFLPQFVSALDQPSGDSAAFLTWRVSQEAKKVVKVLLHGAGADELFLGYPRQELMRQYFLHPGKTHRYIRWVQSIQLLTRIKPLFQYLGFFSLARLLSAMDSDPWMFFLKASSLYPDFDTTYFQKISSPNPTHPLEAAWVWDLDNYLGNDVLFLSDLMSMHQGLELRVPYLDNEVIGFHRRHKQEIINQKRPKNLLKSILEDQKGHQFANRKKQGFGMPLDHWLRSEYKYVDSIIYNSNNYVYHCVDFKEVQTIWEAHKRKKTQAGRFIWSLIVTMLWLEKR
jgi:asparagine synthase (glutamine-hydrolysing)